MASTSHRQPNDLSSVPATGNEDWKDAPSRETTGDHPASHNQQLERARVPAENHPRLSQGDRSSHSPLRLTSAVFTEGAPIPRTHTADGAGMAPPLAWTGVPAGTHSLALVVEDPDALDPAGPHQLFVHWVIYNLPASCRSLPAGADRGGLPKGARLGRNDAGKPRYEGPNPPVGRHRYIFRLFALDVVLPDTLEDADGGTLLRTIQGHILDEAELTGTYSRDGHEPSSASTIV